jgi:glutamine cyclotransferase
LTVPTCPKRSDSDEERERMPSAVRSVLLVLLAAVTLCLPACIDRGQPVATATRSPAAGPVSAPEYTYVVLARYPHDPGAFTQGLAFDGGRLYEGTGRVGQSSLRRVDLTSGKVEQIEVVPPPFFGEGVTVFGDRIFQVTWQSRVGFVYDKATLRPQRKFNYATEGWGLTHDGHRLIMSDGSRTLYYLDPETLEVNGRLEVRGGPALEGAMRLNELEFVRGEIYANVWPTDYIVKIDPHSGEVTGWVNLSGILGREQTDGVDVLNGIAYDAQNDRLFVTGKLWPSLFEIRLIP